MPPGEAEPVKSAGYKKMNILRKEVGRMKKRAKMRSNMGESSEAEESKNLRRIMQARISKIVGKEWRLVRVALLLFSNCISSGGCICAGSTAFGATVHTHISLFVMKAKKQP